MTRNNVCVHILMLIHMFKIYIKSQCLYFISKEGLGHNASLFLIPRQNILISLKWNFMFYTPHISYKIK